MSESGSPRPGVIRGLFRRRVARWVGGVVLTLFVAWLLASRGVGMGAVVPSLLDRFAPEGWDVRVGSVQGDWFSGLVLHDLVVDGVGMHASVPELRVAYRLTPLFSRRIEITEVHLERPSVTMEAPADSAASGSPETARDTTATSGSALGGWNLTVSSARIRGGSLGLKRAAGNFDAESIDLLASVAMEPDAGLSAEIRGLQAALRIEGAASDTATASADGGNLPTISSGHAAAAGSYRDGIVHVDSLTLATNRTDLRASGSLALAPSADGTANRASDVDFRLAARPLDLRDLPVTLPEWLAREPRTTIELTATGDADSTQIVGEATGVGGFALDVDALLFANQRALDATVRITDGVRGHAGTVELGVRESSARWNMDLQLAESSARGNGRVAWGDSPVALEIDRLDVVRLDASVLAPQLPVTSITGRLDGRVRGTTLDDADGILTLRLARSSVVDFEIDSLALDARVEERRVNGRLTATSGVHHVDTRYDAVRAGDAVTGSLTELRLLRFGPPSDEGEVADIVAAPADSVASPADSAFTTDVDVRGSAEFRWGLGGPARVGSLDFAFDSSSVGSISARGDAHVDLVGDRVTGSTGAVVRGIADDSLRVVATLEAFGPTPAGMTGVLEAAITRAGVARAEVTPSGVTPVGPAAGDSLWLSVETREAGRYVLTGALLPAAGGLLELMGEASLGTETAGSSPPTFQASATGSLPAPIDLLSGATVDSIDLRLSGSIPDSTATDLSASLWLVGGRWRTVVADTVVAELRLDRSGALHVDTITADANVLSLRGSGSLPAPRAAPDSIVLLGTILDLDPLRELWGMDVLGADGGQVDFVASGFADDVRVRSRVHLDALVAGQLRIAGLDIDATADGALVGLTVRADSGAMELTLDRVDLTDTTVRSLTARAAGGADSVEIEASAIVDDTRTGELAMTLDPRPEARSASIERVDFQLDEDEWSLSGPASLSYRDGFAVDSFAIMAEGSRIAIDGGVTGDGVLDLTVEMDSTDVGTVSDLLGLPGLDGWLGGRVRLEGTTVAPEGVVDVSGAFSREGGSLGPADIELELDGERVSADIGLQDADGDRLSVTGSVPIPAGGGGDGDDGLNPADSVRLRITSESFDLGWITPFTDPATVTALGGNVRTDLTVTGSRGRPSVAGTVELRDGTATLPALGITYDAIDVFARGADSVLALDSAVIVEGSGRLSASGRISPLPPNAMDLRLMFDDFLAIASDVYVATLSGTVDVTGDLPAPVLNGDLDFESLDVHLDQTLGSDDLDDVELTEQDLTMLRERFGYVPSEDEPDTPLMDRLTADLNVTLGRDSWIRKRSGPEMAVPFTGEVSVRLRPGEEPDVQGELETIADRGFVEQFGRRFTLEDGTVTLEGAPSSARLDVSASYTVPSRDNPDDAEASILLNVSGTRDDLSLEFSSDPPMENADIVSYIATGRPATGSLSFSDDGSGNGLVGTGADLAVGQLVGVLEGAAQRSVGLDVVEIRREGFRDAKLVAGSYVTPRLYVGFAQPINLQEGDGLSRGSQGESEVEVEFAALRWLLLNVEGSGSALRFFLRGRHAY